MIEGNSVDAIETCEVIFVRSVVAMPGNYVQRRVVDLSRPETSEEFRRNMEFTITIFVSCRWGFEVARIRQPNCPEGTKVRQEERLAIVLAEITAGLFLHQLHTEFESTWDNGKLAGSRFQNSQLRVQAQCTQLRNDQEFSICTIEKAITHRCIGRIEMNRHPNLHSRITVAAESNDTIHKVGSLFGQRKRVPT